MKKSIGSGRGSVYTIILKALQSGDKYGYEICKEIEEKSNGTYILKQPSLYSGLKRLEAQKDVRSYWGDSEIGGRRHYYSLTEKGLERISKTNFSWEDARDNVIDNIFEQTAEEKSISQLKNDISYVQNDINEIQKVNQEIDSKLKNNLNNYTENTSNKPSEQINKSVADSKIQRHEVNPSQQDLFSFFTSNELYNSPTEDLNKENAKEINGEEKQEELNFSNSESKLNLDDSLNTKTNIDISNNENAFNEEAKPLDDQLIEDDAKTEQLDNLEVADTSNNSVIVIDEDFQEINNTDPENNQNVEMLSSNNSIAQEIEEKQEEPLNENTIDESNVVNQTQLDNFPSTPLDEQSKINSFNDFKLVSEKSIINVNDYLNENIKNDFLNNDILDHKFYADDILNLENNNEETINNTESDDQDKLYEQFLKSLEDEERHQESPISLNKNDNLLKTNTENVNESVSIQTQQPINSSFSSSENNQNTVPYNANNQFVEIKENNQQNNDNISNYNTNTNNFSSLKTNAENNTENVVEEKNNSIQKEEEKVVINDPFNKKQDDIDYKSIFGDFIQETTVEPIVEKTINNENMLDTKEMFSDYNQTNFSKGTDLPRINVADNINLSLKPKETEQVYKSPFKSYHDDEEYESKDNNISNSYEEKQQLPTQKETVPFDVKYSSSQLKTEDYSVRRYEKIDVKNLESKYINYGKFNLIACLSLIFIILSATICVQLFVSNNIIKFSKTQNQLISIFYVLAVLCVVYTIIYQLYNKNKRKYTKVSISKQLALTFLICLLEVIIVVANITTGIKINELINCYSTFLIPTIINVLLILNIFVLNKIKCCRFLYK